MVVLDLVTFHIGSRSPVQGSVEMFEDGNIHSLIAKEELVEQPDFDLSNGNLELLDPVSNVLLNLEE